MAQKLLVATNPKKRSGRKRTQSAAARRASLRNLKKARAARGGRKRSNPRRSTRKAPARRRAPAKRAAARRRPAARRRAPTRRRTNPARRIVPRNIVRTHVQPALIGGSGAVINDVGYNIALGAIPATWAPDIVDQFRTGWLRHAGKFGSALLLSYAASFVTSKRNADTMAIGAMTVVGYNLARDVVGMVAPQLPLGMYIDAPGGPGLGYAGAGYMASGSLNRRRGSNYRDSGLAAYIRPGGPRRRLTARGGNGNGNGNGRLGAYQRPSGFGVPRQLDVPNFYGRRALQMPEGYSEGH